MENNGPMLVRMGNWVLVIDMTDACHRGRILEI